MNKSGLRSLLLLVSVALLFSLLTNTFQCFPTPTPDDVFGKVDKKELLRKEELSRVNCFSFRDFHGLKADGVIESPEIGSIQFSPGEKVCIQRKYFDGGSTLKAVLHMKDSSKIVTLNWSNAYSTSTSACQLVYSNAR